MKHTVYHIGKSQSRARCGRYINEIQDITLPKCKTCLSLYMSGLSLVGKDVPVTDVEKDKYGRYFPVAYAYPIIRRYSHTALLYLPVCPFCGGSHIHGGGYEYESRKCAEGHRAEHCTTLEWGSPDYIVRLVPWWEQVENRMRSQCVTCMHQDDKCRFGCHLAEAYNREFWDAPTCPGYKRVVG